MGSFSTELNARMFSSLHCALFVMFSISDQVIHPVYKFGVGSMCTCGTGCFKVSPEIHRSWNRGWSALLRDILGEYRG
jgi:hypothetical protein